MNKRNKHTLTRRTALGAGMAGGLLGALSRTSFARAPFAPARNGEKLLTIFYRGGYDAVGSVIPFQDPGYTAALRKATYINPNVMLPIPGNTYCRLNPGMAPIVPVMNAGNVVFLHAVGNPARTGSHFRDQQTWETGITQCSTPPTFDPEEGWVPRAVEQLSLQGFSAASISTNLQQLFQTRTASRILPHIRRILKYPDDAVLRYSLNSNKTALDQKVRGKTSAQAPPSGYGLRALYDSGAQAGHDLDGFARKAGLAMLDSEAAISALATYAPLGGARYPFGHPTNAAYPLPTGAGLSRDRGDVRQFFHRLRDAMWLLRYVPSVRVVGIEIGGVDTHSNQGSTSGQLFELLEAVSFGLQSIDREATDPMFEPAGLTTLVCSEFGRTSEANANGGTDHGGASCVWASGTRVLPARDTTGARVNLVYNGNSGGGTWPGMFSANNGDFGCNPTGNALPKTFVQSATDFRAVFGEALKKVLCVTPTQLDQIIPDYTTLGLANQELGYIL